jgi:Na+/H+ antiporter NhaD/arsenite permease-like protein
MIETLVIILFVAGYVAIAMEHVIRINKTATALILGVGCWTIYSLGAIGTVTAQLSTHLAGIAQIIFFLVGAMTIVELIDVYQGFDWITNLITTRHPGILLWLICWITFLLSAILDNLTTAIVMYSLARKLLPDKEMRLTFAGMIIIASNAGGAWSPIGDVTTTMLWIGGQISLSIVKILFLPSVICLLVPLVIVSFKIKNAELLPLKKEQVNSPLKGSRLMLIAGMAAFMFIPVFKILTGLPPYLGMMLSVGVLWVISECIDPNADRSIHKPSSVAFALSRIDIASALFFLGILLGVGALEAMGTLEHLAKYLQDTIGSDRIIVTGLGLLSAIVDNVPLVAASTGMYSLATYPPDHLIWEYLAYCTGTGGSILIIGSAAGVAIMGMEKINFTWYLRKMTLPATLGFLAGAIAYLLLKWLVQ